MSRPMDRQRLRQLVIVGGAAILLLAAGAGSVALQIQRDWRPDVSGPVLPDWSASVANAREIEITGPEDHFTLTRSGAGWVMPSRDGHPVIPERLAELDAFLADLSYVGARTADPAKHARLELAEAGEPGAGTRLTVRGDDGLVLTDIMIGAARNGRVYLRFPDRPRSYAAQLSGGTAAIPAIALADGWIDLDFLALDPTDIARTLITPERGPAYVFERAGRSARNFSLREPGGWRPITAGAGNGPSAALSRIRFRDVRQADRLRGEPVGRHVEETFSGLRVSLEILALGETRWAVISAVAVTDGGRAAADAINARTAGWAYLLSDLSLNRLLRPLDEIADYTGASHASEPADDSGQ
ncbi:hypothetical protein [Maricaulis sp.]|uniref:hypothetical protein n=1 Tax=Maricaulis sp. TaxID=1486257 RepID=UPI003A9063D9